jgi:transposase
MSGSYCIGLDAHSVETEIAVVTPSGRVRERRRVPTTIPAIGEVLTTVPRPRRVVLEESTIADWLWRNLSSMADEMVVCDPRRNRSIGGAEDKDDPRDALELAQLLRGGYVKAVHHPESLERITFKVQVGMYHDRVRQRVREANRIGGVLRRFGVMVGESGFRSEEMRSQLLARLPTDRYLHADLELAWSGYDLVSAQVKEYRRRLTERAGREEGCDAGWSCPGSAGCGGQRCSCTWTRRGGSRRRRRCGGIWGSACVGVRAATSRVG